MLVFPDDFKFCFNVFTKMIKHYIVCHAFIVCVCVCVLNFSFFSELDSSYIYSMGVKVSMEKFYKSVF